MPEQPLHIEDLPGSHAGICILRLAGPLTLANVFGFQSKVRADNSRALILDFTGVPLADSAGSGRSSEPMSRDKEMDAASGWWA